MCHCYATKCIYSGEIKMKNISGKSADDACKSELALFLRTFYTVLSHDIVDGIYCFGVNSSTGHPSDN